MTVNRNKLIFAGFVLIAIAGVVIISLPSQRVLSREEILKAGLKSKLLANVSPEDIEIQTDFSLGEPIYVLTYRAELNFSSGDFYELFGEEAHDITFVVIRRVYLDMEGNIIREIETS